MASDDDPSTERQQQREAMHEWSELGPMRRMDEWFRQQMDRHSFEQERWDYTHLPFPL